MSHERPWIHNIHHIPYLGKPPPSPYNIFYTCLRGPHLNDFLSRDSQMRVPKLPRLKLLKFCNAIILCVDPRLGWGLKQSCSPHRELYNCVLHATYTQGNPVDSQLFVFGSQIVNLTFVFSFNHNLCFKCPNGSCEPILDIYVSINFQWSKDLFNVMGFDHCNRSLKIEESIGTPTPKMGAHLGVWVFILTLSHTPFWPASLQALSLKSFQWYVVHHLHATKSG